MSPPPHWVVVSRPQWLRLAEAVVEVIADARAAVMHAVNRHRERIQHRRERAALQHLSPHVLRDIGAGSELVAAARERDDRRAAYAEPWRQGL